MASFRRAALSACLFAFAQTASAAEFQFQSVVSLDEMSIRLREAAALGTPRASIRDLFVEQGQAALYAHPERANVEKYVYDINLCQLYVWRWNISANYDGRGLLTQVFLNGEPVHGAGEPGRQPSKKANAKQAIRKAWRERPEASRGENMLAFTIYDIDVASNATDDEFIIGGGPTRADPRNLGTMHVYNAERWRSIFDAEPAKAVVPYAGNCGGG